MGLGSPSSAMSVLLDKGARVFVPAVGLGTVCRLRARRLGFAQLGSWTGTESG